METTIRIHSDALTPQLANAIRAMFPSQMLHITVRVASEQESIPQRELTISDTTH